MSSLPDMAPGRSDVLVGPHAQQKTVMAATAVLALQGPVCIIDGGNRFYAYHLSRRQRRQTPHLESALNCVTIARALTCYRMVSLVARTPATAESTLVSTC